MLEVKRPLKVFLCYASQDKAVVRELSKRLASEGWIDPWVDEKKLLPGEDWRTKIEEAVETSDIVIICLSNNSVSKEGFVQKELRYAREIAFEKPDETIFLIPLRLDNCTVPRGLRFYQWGDYFGKQADETYGALIESLKLRHAQKLNIEEEFAFREKKGQEQKYIESLALTNVEREDAEKAIQEKSSQEFAGKNWVEETQRKVTEETTKEKTKLATIGKIKREGAERRAIQIITLKENLSKSLAPLKLNRPKITWFLGIGCIIGIIVVFSSLTGMPKSSSIKPTKKPTATLHPIFTVTITSTLLPPTNTPIASATQTETDTPVSTYAPIATFAPIITFTAAPKLLELIIINNTSNKSISFFLDGSLTFANTNPGQTVTTRVYPGVYTLSWCYFGVSCNNSRHSKVIYVYSEPFMVKIH